MPTTELIEPIFASIIAYCKLERVRIQTFLNHFALKYQLLMAVLTLGHACKKTSINNVIRLISKNDLVY
jgi:endonuclease/exonuclease/phosphatase (EEP) superfamily protein YafD